MLVDSRKSSGTVSGMSDATVQMRFSPGMCPWEWLGNRCGQLAGHDGRHSWEIPGHAYPEAVGPNGQRWETRK